VQSSESLHLDFDIAAEPRLAIVGIGEPSLTKVVDDQNRSLTDGQKDDARRARARMRFGMARMWGPLAKGSQVHSGQISLHPPAKGARTLKIIRSSVPVYLEQSKKTVVLFADIKKAQGRKVKREGMTFQVDLFFKHPKRDDYELFMTKTEGEGGAFHQGASGDWEIVLQDAKGNSYTPHGWSMGGEEMRFTCGPPFNNAGPLGPPAKLVFIKTTNLTYHVPFEFKDLPLP
jgi:hypothetical protein